jgi:hypothetical protein
VVEWTFLLVFALLFAYALVAWLELTPRVRTHRPFGFLLLTAAMLLQPIAAMSRQRSREIFKLLVAVDLGLLVLAFRALAS